MTSTDRTSAVGGAPRYLAWLLVALLVPVMIIFTVNLAADPLLYRWPRDGWQPTPAYLPFDREVHLNLIAHVHPRSLLLGNSQTQYGLVPAHWRTVGPVINGSMVGADMGEIERALAVAQRNGTVANALVGLDFGMAHGRSGAVPTTHEDLVLAPSGRLRPPNLRPLISYTMLRSSLSGLLRRYRGLPQFYAPSGEALDALYADSVAGHGGTLGSLTGRLTQFGSALREPTVDYPGQIRALRDQACAGQTRLTIFLTPLHAIWIDAIDAAEAYDAWADWKRTIAAIATERRGCGFTLWDFNRYSPITTEPLPVGSGAKLNASWDGVHFRPWVGDAIMARIASDRDAPDGFGVRLTPLSVEAALASDRQAGSAYHRRHPDLATPDAIVQSARTSR
jgi:hypothetical protein